MNNTAIIAASFGTSFLDNLEQTIGAVEHDIQAAFPGCPVYRAFTSSIIRKKLYSEYGIEVDNVEQALKKIQKQQFKHVICQPTHLIFGHEYEKIKTEAKHFLPKIDIQFANPLLSDSEDYFQLIHAIQDLFLKDGITILMGHGTDHFANAVYPALNFYLSMAGFEQVIAGTVEGYPGLEQVIELLERKNATKVLLIPLMLVAGEHANHDMVFNENSWKNILEQRGFAVSYHIRGLGENKKVRDIYVKHTADVKKEYRL